jgi:hypothetical protein
LISLFVVFLQKLWYCVNWVTIQFFNALCGVRHGDDSRSDLGQIEVVPVKLVPVFGPETSYLRKSILIIIIHFWAIIINHFHALIVIAFMRVIANRCRFATIGIVSGHPRYDRYTARIIETLKQQSTEPLDFIGVIGKEYNDKLIETFAPSCILSHE